MFWKMNKEILENQAGSTLIEGDIEFFMSCVGI